MKKLVAFSAFFLIFGVRSVHAGSIECTNWQTAHPDWIWCDDFETDNITTNYYDYDRAGGLMSISSADAYGGTHALQHHYNSGTVSAGYIWKGFGKHPFANTGSTETFTEVYWRFYYKMEAGWQGNPEKITRTTGYWRSDYSQSFIAQTWQSDSQPNMLAIDPVNCASGTTPVCVGYNDFTHMNWLGQKSGVTPIYSSAQVGQWRCLENHVKLNTPGQANGIHEVWIDGVFDTGRTDLNFRGSYTDYGINAIQLEGYWNGGAPRSQNRYMDNLIISRNRIGCGGLADITPPASPTGLRVN